MESLGHITWKLLGGKSCFSYINVSIKEYSLILNMKGRVYFALCCSTIRRWFGIPKSHDTEAMERKKEEAGFP